MNVEVKVEGRVLRLMLANPKNKNILDDETVSELYEAAARWKGKAEILVLSAKGEIFSMGRPRAHFPVATLAPPRNQKRVLAGMMKVRDLNMLLHEWPGVSIGAVRGGAWGAATGMLAHCDVVVAEESAVFAFPEITYGGAPPLVDSYLPKYISRKGAYYMTMSGQEVTAERAADWGLVTEVVPDGELDKGVEKMVKMFTGLKEGNLRANKEILLRLDPIRPELASRKAVKYIATRKW